MSALSSWIAPLELSHFEASMLAQPCCLSPDEQRLTALGELASVTVDGLLAERHTDVIAWFNASDGGLQTASVSPVAARRLHRAGIALYLLDVPQLATLSDDIAAELGVPARNVQCTLFCNPAGSTTRAHFDPVHNLTIQLSGRKRWQLAANDYAALPTQGWATLDRTVPTELALHCQQPLPTQLPQGAAEYELTRGSLLSVPRGWWHQTTSDEASISLHIHYEPILWVDTVLAALRARLLRDEHWRQGLPLPITDADPPVGVHLARLHEVIDELAPDDIIPRRDLPDRPIRLTRRAGASMATIGPVGTDGETQVDIVGQWPGIERHTSLALTPTALRAAHRLAVTSPSAPIRSSDLVADIDDLDMDDAHALITTLHEAGFLRPAEFIAG